MSFFVGVLLFVGVVGWLDAKLPWPISRGVSSGASRGEEVGK
jgi:hypothetical protein